MTAKKDWQNDVGAVWAQEYQRTDRSFAELNDELLARAAMLAEENGLRQILDIGCGAGSTSLALAEKINGAKIIGIDVSPALIDLAISRELDDNCHFELADAEQWSNVGFAPDLIFSRHGVMFFDEPEAAFAHFADITVPDGRLIFSCFRASSENAWASGLSALVPGSTALDPNLPGPFAFADEDKVRNILAAAGWVDIAAEPVNFRYVAGAGDNAVADAMGFFNRVGPVARALREMPEEHRSEILEKLRNFVEDNNLSGRVAFPAAAWIWTARRPSG